MKMLYLYPGILLTILIATLVIMAIIARSNSAMRTFFEGVCRAAAKTAVQVTLTAVAALTTLSITKESLLTYISTVLLAVLITLMLQLCKVPDFGTARYAVTISRAVRTFFETFAGFITSGMVLMTDFPWQAALTAAVLAVAASVLTSLLTLIDQEQLNKTT